MIRLIIIDDEQNARETIASIIKRNCKQAQIAGTADSVKSGVSAIREHKPDVVLLDIHLYDGTGFDILKHFSKIDFKVIFITAFEEFAVKAFRFSALDYILKPVDAEDLVAAVNKAMELIDPVSCAVNLSAFQNNYESKRKEKKKLVLKTSESIYVVNVKDIIRCESDGNYTRFFMNDGQKIFMSKILKEYDELLEGFNFFRVHQSHLINLDYFASYKKSDGGFVKMKDHTLVPVSSRKKDELMQVIEKL